LGKEIFENVKRATVVLFLRSPEYFLSPFTKAIRQG
jgi:hypothetical protein